MQYIKRCMLHLRIPGVVCQQNIEFNMLFDKLLTGLGNSFPSPNIKDNATTAALV